MKRKFQSLLNGQRRFVRMIDLPGATDAGAEPDETNAKGKSPAKKAAPKQKKAEKAEKPAAKKAEKKADKKTAEKPEKKGAKKKDAATVERKPRVEGRIDLVYRSGPERTLAIKVAEKHGHKIEKLEKVDNCTLGVTVAGAKAAALRDEYLSRRDAWRKAQDELIAKHIAKLD